MSNGLFWGCLLIAAGPAFVLYCGVIARKSFLVLLCLARLSAVTLTCIDGEGNSVRLTWLGAPATPDTCVVCRLSAPSVTCSIHPSDSAVSWSAGTCSIWLVDFTQMLCSWLPLSIGEATYYLPACPAMSYFLATALSTLAFFLLHTASMVISFEGWNSGNRSLIALPPCLHMVLSLLTIANLARKGCMAVVPLLLAGGLSMTAVAVRLWLRSLKPGYAALQPDDVTAQ